MHGARLVAGIRRPPTRMPHTIPKPSFAVPPPLPPPPPPPHPSAALLFGERASSSDLFPGAAVYWGTFETETHFVTGLLLTPEHDIMIYSKNIHFYEFFSLPVIPNP